MNSIIAIILLSLLQIEIIMADEIEYTRINETHCQKLVPETTYTEDWEPNIIDYKVIVDCCDGYTMQENQCVPECNFMCINAKCSAPNTCTCNEGYKRSTKISCYPICTNECKNGFCSSPNKCTCNDGFKLNDENERCEPVCGPTGCINGKCTNPDLCKCDDGYLKDNNDPMKCNPICNPICLNGECINGKCNCVDGFQLITNQSGQICQPYCDPPCQNEIFQKVWEISSTIEIKKLAIMVSVIATIVGAIVIIVILWRRKKVHYYVCNAEFQIGAFNNRENRENVDLLAEPMVNVKID